MRASIKRKFLFTQASAILISVALMGGLSYLMMVDALKELHREKLSIMAAHLSTQVETAINTRMAILDRVETLDYRHNYRDLALAEHFSRFSDTFSVLSYLNREGREEVKVVEGHKTDRLKTSDGGGWLEQTLEQPNVVVVSDLHRSPDLEAEAIDFAVARYGYFGDEFQGILKGTVPLAQLTEPLHTFKTGERGFAILSDADGRLLFHPDPEKLLDPLREYRHLRDTALEADEEMGRMSLYGLDGLVASAKVEPLDWWITVILPYSEFIATPRHLAAIALLSAFLSLGLGLIIAHSKTQPLLLNLQLIRSHTEKVAAGDLRQRLGIDSGDELQSLAESVNTMTDGISQALASRDAFQRILQAIIDPMIITDHHYRILQVNRPALVLLRAQEKNLIGKPFTSLFGPQGPQAEELIGRAESTGSLLNQEIEVRNGSDEPIPVLLSCALTDTESASEAAMVVIFKDISERKCAEEEIRKLAYFDALTGLPNRVLLMAHLEKSLHQAQRNYRRHGERMALFFLDLDNFKVINDTLGHETGDLLLQSAARRIQDILRKGDTVARFVGIEEVPCEEKGDGTFARIGGDEFVILLPGVRTPEDVVVAARKIISAMEAPFQLHNYQVFTPVTIGIAMYPEDGRESGTLLKNADMAMYSAKAQGRNTFHFFSSEMNCNAQDRLLLENYLRQDLARGAGFSLHYQKKVDLASGRLCGMEALLRWNHPELGPVPPARLIPLAEETGLIVQLGEWVLREACRQNRQWQDMGFEPLKIAVNLSARQLRHPSFSETLLAILEETGLEPQFLELELTESMLMDNTGQTSQILEGLKRIGVTLTIDDFGTGYSSLSYLKRFPIDNLKIDRSFVSELGRQSDDAEIIKVILALGESLRIRIIAEGVETKEQLEFLQNLQCDEAQGYLLGPPVPAPNFQEQHLTPSLGKAKMTEHG